MDPTASIERDVRELVRRRGVDPERDRAAVRRLVDEVLADYDERSLVADLPLLADRADTGRAVLDAVAGYGPLQRHLDDPEVVDVRKGQREDGTWLAVWPRVRWRERLALGFGA